MDSASEASSLVSKPERDQNYKKHCCCRVNYRLPVITEKGAIILLVCNALILTAIISQLQKNYFIASTTIAFAIMSLIIFPIAGILANTYVSRLKVVQLSIALLIISSLFNIVLLLLQHYIPTTMQTVIIMFTEGCAALQLAAMWPVFYLLLQIS